MLLSEVAVGENPVHLRSSRYMKGPPKGFTSTIGCGANTPDPTKMVVGKDGVGLPLGGLVNRSAAGFTLNYNEYIVYDESRVHMKYLLQFE